MLNSETKRRIDTARDILVGKLPDPKSQVEQITIALIYKFMDDMDKESEELGGKPFFFTGEFSRYSWSKIFDYKVGGHEIFGLYTEAIQKMNQNPNIPQLFRDIFKNAYLPYRDPETLKSFLKVINDFSYDHSEKLGDAFEYLLSIMDSQGEAGQFRTPRHIIDFIVSIVSPSKNDTILDPACGTAGFLISSYKYILNQNSVNGQVSLTPEEKKKLVENFVGYDISPDMVRLSLVNMYLHGYQNPHIYEYDALTSEERWNDSFDVIMANPPFMTPRGGIKPHKRFSIQANRSEVLFVDYIAEHLTPKGRGGVIVPEGVIFQSGIAYKTLRKMLLEHFLFAVVSLPAGVFNPYSGVKTSILLMDKSLAKKSDEILFVKVTSDGFALGAQRKEMKDDDLPLAFEIVSKFKNSIVEQKTCVLTDLEKNIALVVKKQEINSDYNLSMERYQKREKYSGKWSLVELGDPSIFSIESGGTPSSENEDYWNGNIKWATLADLPKENFVTEIYDTERKITELGLKNSSAKLIPKDSILVSSRATIGRIGINRVEIATNQGFKNIIIKDRLRANEKFIAFMISSVVEKMNALASGGTFKEISKTSFSTIKIPLPPLKVQEQIVSEIDSYQKVLNGAKQVVGEYKPIIKIKQDWLCMQLGEVTEFVQGINTAIDKLNYVETGVKVLQANNIFNGYINFDNLKYIKKEEFESIPERFKPTKEDILYSNIGARFGYASSIDLEEPFTISWNVMRIIIKNPKMLNKYYLKAVLNSDRIRTTILSKSSTSTMPFISGKELKQIEIPIPPIEIQEEIASQLEEEQKLVNSNKRLVAIFEEKIKNKIIGVWGENE